jgi:phospholipid transport system transporter-binding protein
MSRRSETADEFKLEALGGGRFRISGAMTFSNVTAILEASKELFGETPLIKLDLSGVAQGDSAGLALLLEWINWSTAYGREIRYSGIPSQILAIARISEVEDLLQAGERVDRGTAPAETAGAE